MDSEQGRATATSAKPLKGGERPNPQPLPDDAPPEHGRCGAGIHEGKEPCARDSQAPDFMAQARATAVAHNVKTMQAVLAQRSPDLGPDDAGYKRLMTLAEAQSAKMFDTINEVSPVDELSLIHI